MITVLIAKTSALIVAKPLLALTLAGWGGATLGFIACAILSADAEDQGA